MRATGSVKKAKKTNNMMLKNIDGGTMAGFRLAVLSVVVAGAGAWTMTVRSCCETHACENMRFLYGQIAGGYETCCQKTLAQQDACFDELDDKISATQTLILTAKMECDTNNDAAVRDIIKQIRELWMPKIIKSAAGAVQNQMVALGTHDYIALDTTLLRTNLDCKPVTVTIIGGTVVNAEATGKAAEDSPRTGDGTSPAVVVPSDAAQPYSTCTYTVPADSSFDIRFADVRNGISLSGTISIAQTASQVPDTGSADLGLPTAVSLEALYLGQKLTLELDKTCPYNTLRLDANGVGTLGVALTLKSDSHHLIGLVQIGSTIYFNLPVQMSQNWSSLRIHSLATTPGSTITPTVPAILAGADVPPHAGIAMERCTDNDGNGIRDGADALINAIESQHHCLEGAGCH